MDPNAALSEIREHMDTWRKGSLHFADADRTLELVGALDEWLSNGGFLPDDWNPDHPKTLLRRGL